MSTLKSKESVLFTWLHILAMVAFILGVGYFTFIVVADKGQSSWDYRSVKSIPSESPYAIYEKNPAGQHVNTRGGTK